MNTPETASSKANKRSPPARRSPNANSNNAATSTTTTPRRRARSADSSTRPGFFASIVDAVADTVMEASVTWNSMDCLDLAKLSMPLGICANALLFACRLSATKGPSAMAPGSAPTSGMTSSSMAASAEAMVSKIPAFDLKKILLIQAALFVISVLNTLWLFTTTRRYDFFQPPTNNPPTSPNIKAHSVQTPSRRGRASRSPRVTEFDSDDEDLTEQFEDAAPVVQQNRSSLWTRLKQCFKSRSVNRSPAQTRKALQLSLWDPQPFNLNFFCLFSPVQILILLGTDSNSLVYYTFASFLVAAGQFALVQQFAQMVRDKQTVFENLWHEYDEQFVKPRLSVRKMDKAMQTEGTIMSKQEAERLVQAATVARTPGGSSGSGAGKNGSGSGTGNGGSSSDSGSRRQSGVQVAAASSSGAQQKTITSYTSTAEQPQPQKTVVTSPRNFFTPKENVRKEPPSTAFSPSRTVDKNMSTAAQTGLVKVGRTVPVNESPLARATPSKSRLGQVKAGQTSGSQ